VRRRLALALVAGAGADVEETETECVAGIVEVRMRRRWGGRCAGRRALTAESIAMRIG